MLSKFGLKLDLWSETSILRSGPFFTSICIWPAAGGPCGPTFRKNDVFRRNMCKRGPGRYSGHHAWCLSFALRLNCYSFCGKLDIFGHSGFMVNSLLVCTRSRPQLGSFFLLPWECNYFYVLKMLNLVTFQVRCVHASCKHFPG